MTVPNPPPRPPLRAHLCNPAHASRHAGQTYPLCSSFVPHPGWRFVIYDSYDFSILGRNEDDPTHIRASSFLRQRNPNSDLNDPTGMRSDLSSVQAAIRLFVTASCVSALVVSPQGSQTSNSWHSMAVLHQTSLRGSETPYSTPLGLSPPPPSVPVCILARAGISDPTCTPMTSLSAIHEPNRPAFFCVLHPPVVSSLVMYPLPLPHVGASSDGERVVLLGHVPLDVGVCEFPSTVLWNAPVHLVCS